MGDVMTVTLALHWYRPGACIPWWIGASLHRSTSKTQASVQLLGLWLDVEIRCP